MYREAIQRTIENLELPNDFELDIIDFKDDSVGFYNYENKIEYKDKSVIFYMLYFYENGVDDGFDILNFIMEVSVWCSISFKYSSAPSGFLSKLETLRQNIFVAIKEALEKVKVEDAKKKPF